MEPQKKRSLALTLIGHGVVLMILFLGAAFVRKPVLEYMEVDLGPGGPKNPGPLGTPPSASAPREETPEPPQPNPPTPKEAPAPKPEPEKTEFPTKPKKPPVKKPEPAKPKKPVTPVAKPPPKKTPAKTAAKNTVQKSNKLVVRNSTTKTTSKTVATGDSAAEIKRRMEGRIGHASGSADSTEPGGDGSGNKTGSSNKFAVYLGGLQEQIQVAWEQPSSAVAGLTTEISFFLEKSGHLTGFKISKSSGNAEMDQSALLAAKSVGNYQPWPEDFTSDLAQITVEFVCKPNH